MVRSNAYWRIYSYSKILLIIPTHVAALGEPLGHIIETSTIIHSYKLFVFVAVLEEPLAA